MTSNGSNGSPLGHRSRSSSAVIVGSDGVSTESDAESSYQGWSDRGWRTSSSNPPRLSLSSSDEHSAVPSPTTAQAQGIPVPPARAVAFTSPVSPNSMSHRRQTVSRPSIHTVGSNLAIAGLTGTNHSTVLTLGDVASPASAATPFNQQPPTYPEATSTSAYTAYPRSRRKSTSHVATGSISRPGDPETSPDEGYHLNGVAVGTHGKGKKKKSRAGSFSLPFHRRRRLSNAGWTRWWRFQAKRHFASRFGQVTTLLFLLIFGVYIWRRHYEIQLEFSVFSHDWVRTEVDAISPLRGCFNPPHLSPFYDLERHRAPATQLLAPGISLQRGTQCYDFSATIQSSLEVPLEPLTYHTYWRSDLIPFGERHTATLLAFLATQPLTHSKLILWTNGVDVVANNSFIKPFLDKWGNYIEVRHVDMDVLTRGTELEGILSGNNAGGLFDERAWVDGDAVRLLVLWHHGGIWMDMDQILTRDLHPLTDQEFVTQWDCHDRAYFSLNGALMHFRQHSPYLCEAFHIMATSPLPRPNTFTWGSHLYSKLHRRLLANHVKPFAVLPWCLSDPRNCRSDTNFPDPFGVDPDYWGGRRWDGRGEVGRSGREMLQEKIGYIFTIHLHNQWKKEFQKDGWMSKLLDGYHIKVDAIERHARTIVNVAHAKAQEARKGGGTAAGAGGGAAVGAGVDAVAGAGVGPAAVPAGSKEKQPHQVGDKAAH